MEQASAKGLSVVCLAASIPRSYYLIPSSARSFTLNENGTTVTVSLAVGNYSVSTFRTALKTALDAASPNGRVYTVAFSTLTGKFTYTVSVGPASLIMPSTGGIYEQFGFEPGSTNTLPISSTNVVKFIAEDTLQIHSDIVDCGDDVLQDILGTGAVDFSSITYRCVDHEGYAKPMRTKNGNVYRFSITNEDGNLMDLNGLNVVITIMVFAPLDGLIRRFIGLLTA
jgi:hypothetical protein